MDTKPRSTRNWLTTIAIGFMLVVVIGLTVIPFINLSPCGAYNSETGNHLRMLVMNVLVLHNDDNAWPSSTEEYRRKCEVAALDNGLRFKDRRAYVAWDNFRRAETENRVLPVCMMLHGRTVVAGFSDGHYEHLSEARWEKIIQAGLVSLPYDKSW